MGEIVPLRRPGAPDPLADTGRLGRIQAVCTIGQVPGIAMHLFEAGCAPDVVTRAIAQAVSVLPRRAPFPDLIADPFPRDDD